MPEDDRECVLCGTWWRESVHGTECPNCEKSQSAMLLTDQEWSTLADLVTVFEKSGGYLSPERKALIKRIKDAV